MLRPFLGIDRAGALVRIRVNARLDVIGEVNSGSFVEVYCLACGRTLWVEANELLGNTTVIAENLTHADTALEARKSAVEGCDREPHATKKSSIGTGTTGT